MHIPVSGPLDRSSPVESLDQVYAQPAVVQQLLLEKLNLWAQWCDGMVEICSGEGTHMPYSDVWVDPELLHAVTWPPLKSFTRVMEKHIRCCNSDPSFLLDVACDQV